MSQEELIATQDIKEDLEQKHKTFIPFIKALDPIMDKLVKNYYNKQTCPHYF